MDRMAGWTMRISWLLDPSFPARRNLRLDQPSDASSALPLRLDPVSFRGFGEPRQRLFFTDAALAARRATPRAIHVEAIFKTKRRNGTIALLMPLTAFFATFAARHRGCCGRRGEPAHGHRPWKLAQ